MTGSESAQGLAQLLNDLSQPHDFACPCGPGESSPIQAVLRDASSSGIRAGTTAIPPIQARKMPAVWAATWGSFVTHKKIPLFLHPQGV